MSEPIRGVRGQRYGGPRFGGRGVLAVFGLLGILVTLGIMAILAVKVLQGTSGTGLGTGDGLPVPTTAASAPASLDPAAPTAAANAAACQTDADTVRTAAEAYQVINGAYPPDVATLEASGLVAADAPIAVEIHVVAGELQVVGTGACAGLVRG